MFGHSKFMFNRGPLSMCYELGGGGTAGGGTTGGTSGTSGGGLAGGSGFQVVDGQDTGEGSGEQHPDAGGDDNTLRYTKKDVETMIQGRVKAEQSKLDKAYADTPHLRNLATRLQETTGLKVSEIMQRIDVYDRQQKDQRAVQMGLSPAVASEITSAREDAALSRQEIAEMRLDREEEKLLSDPKFVGYTGLKDDIRTLAKEKGIPLKQAYAALTFDNPQINSQRERENEARLSANQQQRQTHGTVQFDASKSGTRLKYTAEQEAAAKVFGLSVEDYLISDASTDIDVYRRLNSEKNERLKGGKK